MDASDHEDLPEALARARSRFQAWRFRRPAGGRIPRPLWALAVRLVNRHGVSRTANALGLDYYSLKKRAASADGEAPSNGPAFVELHAPSALGKQCQVELDNGAGASMRIQLAGYDAADVEAIVRSFWNGG